MQVVDLRLGRVPSLDGLRAVAILMVLLAHARASFACPSFGFLDWTTKHGLLGVEVFFSISGFLITLLMLREIDRTGRVSLSDFYLRRVLRIVPAYAVFLCVVAWLVHERFVAYSRGDWVGALTYSFNFHRQTTTWELGHLWSLSIEEQFYLVWPIVLLLTPRKMRIVPPVIALIVALGSRCAFVWIFQRYNYAVRAWTFCRIDSIAAGCLLAIAAWEPAMVPKMRRFGKSWVSPLVAFVVLCVSIWLTNHSAAWDPTISYSCNALAITWLIWCAICMPASLLGRLLNTTPAVWLGTLSYSLYLWQQIFLSGAAYPWTHFPRNVLFAILAACFSFVVVERPFLLLKDRLGKRRHGQVLIPAEVPCVSPLVEL